MDKLVNRLFARYGSEAELLGEQTQKVRVFFESVNSKSKYSMEDRQHPLGKLPGGQYICRFPGGTAVSAGDNLKLGQKNYRICRVEEMTGPGGSRYLWALCVGEGSEGAW